MSSTLKFEDLPPETIEEILLFCDPIDVASVGQCSRAFAMLIHHPPDQHLWRELYLLQPLDDPRICLTRLGRPFIEDNFDWKAELGLIMRARTVVAKDLVLHDAGQRIGVLRTLIKVATTIPPRKLIDGECHSKNVLWLMELLKNWSFVDQSRVTWESEEEETQLRARLHCYYGLTTADTEPSARVASRAYVYSWRNHIWDNDFGPFIPSSNCRVNWVHVQAVNHVMGTYVSEMGLGSVLPMTLDETQIVTSAPDADPRDWAGVTGTWLCSFCFCDHSDLQAYNQTSPADSPLDTSIFASSGFHEVFRTLSVTLRLTGTKPNSDHPDFPEIWFGGYLSQQGTSATYTMTGKVCMTPDRQVHWHFVSGETGNPIWSSEGVQVGSLRSAYGVLGSWTTVFHDSDDPVGPFWLRQTTYKEEDD